MCVYSKRRRDGALRGVQLEPAHILVEAFEDGIVEVLARFRVVRIAENRVVICLIPDVDVAAGEAVL